MAFLDHITLEISAGRGGDGVVRWRREKGISHGGPWGGDGGKGGDVYFVGARNMHALNKYRNERIFEAEHGQPGATKLMHGKNGRDLELFFPLGTKIYNIDLDITYELLEEGERILALRGGQGGLGNNNFKNSIRRAPKIATPGKKGEFATFDVELQLIADIGFVGFPNAGKSSLLNVLTNANAKTADYEFTTLEPNLGECYGYIFADLPGLIEGASEGKGLGHLFLKHIERTGAIAHLVAADEEDVVARYEAIRAELKKYSEAIAKKKEIIILSKSDTVSEKELEKKKKALEKKTKNSVHTLSVYDDTSIKACREALIAFVAKK